jgi:tetratricopeptide (TPR) repeat protein
MTAVRSRLVGWGTDVSLYPAGEYDMSAPANAIAPAPPAESLPESAVGRAGWLPLWIIFGGVFAYWNSFAGRFVFDDRSSIVPDVGIRQTALSWAGLVKGRSLTDLSFAANYAIGGLDPWGYHAVNLAIHILAALTLFGVVRRTLLQEPRRDRYCTAAPWLALAIALLWCVHPLQTGSVTYIIQRAESMMGLFYLLTLYCFIRSTEAGRGRVFWVLAAAASLFLAMRSKEVAVTAPVVLLLYDVVFLSGSFLGALRRRAATYTLLVVVAGVAAFGIVANVLASARPGTTEGEYGFNLHHTSPLEYALSQPGVILHYLRLAFWPTGLCLDYYWPVARDGADVIPAGVVILLLLGLTAWLLVRRSWLGFLGAWFFLILAPTSSVMPLKDLAFEHRMYLPLAAVVALVVLGGYALLQGPLARLTPSVRLRSVVLGVLVVVPALVLALHTRFRNRAYGDLRVMWADVVAKRPANPRGHVNLGTVLIDRGDKVGAEEHFRTAVDLEPQYAIAQHHLGQALALRGRYDEGELHLRKAIDLDPDWPQPHVGLGICLHHQGKAEEACEQFEAALRLNPNHALAHYDLGLVLKQLGKKEEAREHFAAILRVNPHSELARRALDSLSEAESPAPKWWEP